VEASLCTASILVSQGKIDPSDDELEMVSEADGRDIAEIRVSRRRLSLPGEVHVLGGSGACAAFGQPKVKSQAALEYPSVVGNRE